MNINCHLTLTDEQRNILKQRITGKRVKALATRAEVCELVNDYIQSLVATVDLSKLSAQRQNFSSEAQVSFKLDDDAHPDCCKSVELMRTRMNLLQRHIDTKVSR